MRVLTYLGFWRAPLLFRMKQSIALGTARTWNQKNLPSDIERFDQTSGGTARLIRRLPSVAVGLARRRPRILALALAVLGVVGLVWFLSEQE